MIKKLILSLLIIAGVSAAAFTASRALLSDNATLAASTFSVGTVDLQISKSNTTSGGTFYSDSIAGFSDSILPGQTKSELLWLKNDGTNVDFSIAGQSSSISGEINPNNLTVAFTPVSSDASTNVGTKVSHTLSEWESVQSLDSNIAHGGKQRYKMEVTLDSGVSSSGSITFDFVFTGTQTELTPTPTATPTFTLTPTPTTP